MPKRQDSEEETAINTALSPGFRRANIAPMQQEELVFAKSAPLVREQLCQLKTKCALSLCILLVLLLEAIVRRVEHSAKTYITSAYNETFT